MKRRNIKGFTLGEVLLVVAIISALTAIGIPSLMKEIDKAKLRVDQAHVQEAVSMATSQYAADHTEGKRWYYYDANRSEIKKILLKAFMDMERVLKNHINIILM